jgi:hypothetical protein
MTRLTDKDLYRTSKLIAIYSSDEAWRRVQNKVVDSIMTSLWIKIRGRLTILICYNIKLQIYDKINR